MKFYFVGLDAYTTAPNSPANGDRLRLRRLRPARSSVVQDGDGDLNTTTDQRVEEEIYNASGNLIHGCLAGRRDPLRVRCRERSLHPHVGHLRPDRCCGRATTDTELWV